MLTQQDLDQFTGTETYYRHPLSAGITYTEGVQFMAERAGAYWLLDIIVSAQHEKTVKCEEFQVWKLNLNTVEKDGTATVTCEDGDGTVVYTQDIQYTDFPLPSITLFFTNGVILLPSEY
jgi:hypothetical protein